MNKFIMKNILFSHYVWLALLPCFVLLGMQMKAESPSSEKNKKNIKEHFYYALPQNYFTVTVKVTKNSTFEGPLSDYAGKVTGLSSVVKENAVHYELKDINLAIHSQLDLQQVYYVEVPASDASLRLLYKDLLVPACITKQNTAGQTQPSVSTNNKLYTQNRFSIYTADAMMEKYDTTYISQITDTIVVRIPKITKRLVAKPTQQQAQEAIKTIEQIREARWLLISGDYETDFSNLELMLNELKQKENEYLALFSGTTETEELTYTFTVIPSKQENKIIIPLFYFSEKQGITKKGEDSHQMEYVLRLNPSSIQDAVNKAKNTFLETQSDRRQNNSPEKQTGLYYRNPAYYSVSIYNGINLVENFGTYPVAQLGQVLMLPSNVYSFEIDSQTGALLYLETTK
jgi:hypothetical protein